MYLNAKRYLCQDICVLRSLQRLTFPKVAIIFDQNLMKTLFVCLLNACLLAAVPFATFAQKRPEIPAAYKNLNYDDQGRLYLEINGERSYERMEEPPYTLTQMQGDPKGTETGIAFDFGSEAFVGKLYFGLIPYGDSKHPHPVYLYASMPIEKGKAHVDISRYLSGRYDMIGWEESGHGTLGYRVANASGAMLYDGKVSFKGTGPFKVDATLLEGPTVHQVTANSAVIAFTTNKMVKGSVKVGDQMYGNAKKTMNHEVVIKGLNPSTSYSYEVAVGEGTQTYSFKTAPEEGSRTAFTFAYASDSRAGNGGGERNIYGANSYIMKKIMALAMQRDISFFQFSGDLINGYVPHNSEIDLQYANWKRSVEPFAHYFPVYISMGNHEALVRRFDHEKFGSSGIRIDRFPYSTESGETAFARNFVNPHNGPASEDGASYDPDPDKIDFPSYEENVFYYTHDNVGVIVLNSDYWYTPSKSAIPIVGGGLHGYIMDQQLAWFEKTLQTLEADENIDHVFVTQHTPIFPNGGHVGDDMWYNGNNQYRPFVNGKGLAKGIIERRNQLLDLMVNKSQKVLAVLTGDEHNFALTSLDGDTKIHPDDFFGEKVKLSRTLYQVNNGAAGAPYYAQQETPWTPAVSNFTTQHALVLFHVDGDSVEMEVVNPDTLEEIMRKKLR